MALVRFESNVPRHTRKLSKKDFESLGVEHDKIEVGAGEVVVVSDDAADALVKLGEFKRVDSEDAAKEVADITGTSQVEVPPGSGGGSQVGTNTRDGAGARTARTR